MVHLRSLNPVYWYFSAPAQTLPIKFSRSDVSPPHLDASSRADSIPAFVNHIRRREYFTEAIEKEKIDDFRYLLSDATNNLGS